MPFTFYLGTNKANWLWGKPSRHPLFVSIRTINRIKSRPIAINDWCCDSGGFTELSLYDKWVTTPEQYVDDLYSAMSIGRMVWASPQDWMCEPHMIDKTGLNVEKHQQLTCENFATLQQIAPDLPIIPVLQGWQPDDYRTHFAMYERYGVNLRNYRTVGLGSFCRRANVSGVRELVIDLHNERLKLHGFGLKKDGLALFGDHLVSSDSMAWSLTGRIAGRKNINLCGASHRAKGCGDCWEWAQTWADRVATTQQTANPLLWETLAHN
jgi:hypothetical protein